jgi:chromosome segregation ATPase
VNKKTKTDGEVEAGDKDDSRITDSVLASQPSKPSQQEWKEKSAAMKKTEEELRTKLREKEAMLKDRDTRLRTIENDFDMQMNRFEDQSRKLIEVQGQLDRTTKDLEDANERLTQREEFIAKIKDESNQLKDDLKAACLALYSSQVPEVSELERLRREKEEAEKVMQKVQKELANKREVSGYPKEDSTMFLRAS